MLNSKETKTDTGLVFNIQRFSFHDGPGIRTTVFLKGCPLRCGWCSNPESMNSYVEIMAQDTRCIGCGQCGEVCPQRAISIGCGRREIDREKCNLCLKCIEVCPSGAIELVGKFMSVEEVVAIIEKDRLFYLNSGGGVTFSGGEPLNQWKFVLKACRACKEKGIHTALDTTGYGPWDIFEKVLEYCDLVLYDLKHPDSTKHQEGTGVGNELVLENASKAASKRLTWFRVPIIPGYNDSVPSMEKTIQLALRLGIERISILPYHKWGVSKYSKLGRKHPCYNGPITRSTEEKALEFSHMIENRGIEASIGS